VGTLAASVAAPAPAADGSYDRAWGKDVDQGGGTGAEVCVVATNCRGGQQNPEVRFLRELPAPFDWKVRKKKH